MSQEPDALAADVAVDREVMAAVERDEQAVFVIADVTRDNAYLSMDLEDAATLSAWR
ncbi:conserved hypothetical protein [Halorhabdus utahensis DSM 12940]|uniref:Uncharacterized protein n=1 Tax=Halorhabdus utahensis (strain DSM 12940 / JCM 11049 / AX-2) TaxID=519442 RepID=C7NP79_HALUD|nr:hypothetical protein [Halorhabdus utahensis]ACV11666.1 conserved hypothetical protein [Halorhabdus utahensis DSM 12940]